MFTPIYAEINDKEIINTLSDVQELIREIEKKTAFLTCKKPMLCAVPAPDNDCISIGKIVVCGVSTLNKEQKEVLVALLKEFDSLSK